MHRPLPRSCSRVAGLAGLAPTSRRALLFQTGDTEPLADSDPASRPKVAGLAAEFPENWFRVLPTSGPNVCSAHSREGPPGRLKSHTARHPPPAAACQAAVRSQLPAKRRQRGARAQGLIPATPPGPPGPPGGGPLATWRLPAELHRHGSLVARDPEGSIHPRGSAHSRNSQGKEMWFEG